MRDGKPTTVSLLLTSREKKALNRNYFNTFIWRPALQRVGVPGERENGCHALRHFYASTALHEGETIKAVSEYLGHADPGFTLRTYTHLMDGSAERTRRAIDAAFREGTPRTRARPVRASSDGRATSTLSRCDNICSLKWVQSLSWLMRRWCGSAPSRNAGGV